MVIKEKSRLTLISLIEKALQGSISLEEFYLQWPEELEGKSRFDNIYDDLENAIEHFPAGFFSGKPKMDVFQRSIEYQRLKVHLENIKNQA